MSMTIRDMLIRAAAERGDGVALRFKHAGAWRELSYAGLLTRARRVGEVLAGLRIRPGDRVGLYLENCSRWPEVYFGITGIGAAAVPVDAGLLEQGAAHVLRDSGARALISSARHYGMIRDLERTLPGLEHVMLIDGTSLPLPRTRGVTYRDYEQALDGAADRAATAAAAFERFRPEPAAPASIIYTSGT
ncbi:MAG: AMP-binding protein, partial [Lentisphaerae bacterium]|nr:AMP-binding protein [Lentisphaerota bacterium]